MAPCRLSPLPARTVLLFLLALVAAGEPPGRAAAAPAEVPNEGLLLPSIVGRGRSSYTADPLAVRLAAGDWKPPREGDEVTSSGGTTVRWETIRANKDGTFANPRSGSGYLYLPVTAAEEQVLVLEAAGHGMVYVNGEPRVGDIYDTGYVRVPVLLHPGTNDLLFRGGRFSKVRAKLVSPKSPAFLNTGDLTLPDAVVGQAVDADAAVVVVNATNAPAEQLAVEAVWEGGEPTRTPVPPLLPLGVRKAGFRLRGPAPEREGKAAVELRLVRKDGDRWQTLDTARINLGVVRPGQTRKVTFRSGIDGSVQYYGLVPAAGEEGESTGTRPGLILTLHGAGVEGIGQAACYGRKSWAHVVAPTNRRPFGFDWEDWGRLDALEVLDHAQKQLNTDPRRTCLTGHSMGGHGTWHLGVTYPGRFAAIAPSAGWISMMTYAGARPGAGGGEGESAHLADLLRRPLGPSDTLALLHNYALEGVYILHGDRDDNVPVSEARRMRQELGTFHPDFAYHEQPGAGHWWGNACVDWPPLIEFLERRRLPAPRDVRQVVFATASPGVSAWCHWAGIEAQAEQGKLSSVDLRCDPDRGRFTGKTANVARLALDVGHLKEGVKVEVELDGDRLGDVPRPAEGTRLWFRREGGKWSVGSAPAASLKGPDRYGPFKDAFRNQVVLVYGTHGTPEANAAMQARARFDAEQFWYIGNGSLDVVPDTAWEAAAGRDRNVVLYGNADVNTAWQPLLGDSPVQVHRGAVRVGDRTEKGNDLACLFLRPRSGSDRALVGAVAATGPAGMRRTAVLPYFHSGTGYPDWVVLGSDGQPRGAGFFGIDWKLETGESAWRP